MRTSEPTIMHAKQQSRNLLGTPSGAKSFL